MKTNKVFLITAFSIFVISNTSLLAQYYNTKNAKENYNQSAFIGFGLGINDYGLGAGLEFPLNNKLNAYGNMGVGGWGYKLGVGVSYYPRQAPFGSAFNFGYSYALGLSDLETELEVAPGNSTEEVLLDLNPVVTFNLFYSYSWTLGRRGKFSLSAGYAIPLKEEAYELKTPNIELNATSKAVLKIMQPGGFIIGLKFLFRI